MLAFLRLLPVLALLGALAPAGSRAATAPQTGSCSAPLVLDLRADPDPGRPASAPPIPPGIIHLRVPLYPGAHPSSRRMPLAAYGTPSSWYRKDARATYLVPGDWDTVQAWYSTAFTGCGFRSSGAGYSGNRGGIVAQSLSFSFGAHTEDQVTLNFERAGANHTLVLYAASAIVLPPPQILVPGTPSGATVSYYASYDLAAPPRAAVSIQSHSTLFALIRDLNHLPVADEPGYCPMDTGVHATIQVRYASGPSLTLSVGFMGCRDVVKGTSIVAHSTNALLNLLSGIR